MILRKIATMIAEMCQPKFCMSFTFSIRKPLKQYFINVVFYAVNLQDLGGYG